MKKIFYIPLVAMVMAFATTSCDNADEPQLPGSSIHSNEDSGDTQAVALTIEMPEDAPRSRNFQGNGWFGFQKEVNCFRYVLYRYEDDGTRTQIVNSDIKEESHYATEGKYHLYLKLPKGFSYKAYFIADAYGTDFENSSHTVDWENEVIEVDQSKALGSLDMSDMFVGAIDFEVGYSNTAVNVNLPLKRPHVQLNVLSADTMVEDMAAAFKDGMRTYIYYKDAEGNAIIPYRWHFDGTIDFKTLTEDEIKTYTSMNLGLSTYKLTQGKYSYDYWYSGYLFAPATAGDWASVTSGSVPNTMVIKYGFDDGRIFNEIEFSKEKTIDKIGTNHRLIFFSSGNSTVVSVSVNGLPETSFIESGIDPYTRISQ